MCREQFEEIYGQDADLDIVIVDVDSIDLVIHVDFHNQIVDKHVEQKWCENRALWNTASYINHVIISRYSKSTLVTTYPFQNVRTM